MPRMFISRSRNSEPKIRGDIYNCKLNFLCTIRRWVDMRAHWFSSIPILDLETSPPFFPIVLDMDALPGPTVSDDDVPKREKYSTQTMSRIQSFLLHKYVDDNVCNQTYPGSGTDIDPYIVDYLHNDPQDA